MRDPQWQLPPDRYFDPDPTQRRTARELYESVAQLPLVCPHGHVAPRLFADENASFGSPADLLIIPDHYVFRLLYSHGISLEDLGIRPIHHSPDLGSVSGPGAGASSRPSPGLRTLSGARRGAGGEVDHRQVWQTFADNFHLFRGTPTGVWLANELQQVFGVQEKLTGRTAQGIYDHIAAKLATAEFRPRALFERFNIEVLTTTDAATDPLVHHQAMRASGWKGDIRPTFRPDGVVNLLTAGWRQNIDALSQVSGIHVTSYRTFVQALEKQRVYFKSMGAVATDHAAQSAYTAELTTEQADAILQRALRGQATADDANRFTGHMIMESARMSIEDGLVMQFHVGSVRNHNQVLFERFGPDMGSDIPERSDFTHNLRPLLNKYGTDPRLTFIVFTLDPSTYARELAPLAGHYPAMKLGPPWWFFDSPNGMKWYFEGVMETAGIHNTVGFNDDTRAFPSIPARHDLWRRVSANWLAGLVVRSIVDMDDAREMALDLAYRLARRAYKLENK